MATNTVTSTSLSSTPSDMKPRRIAFIQACWHREIVDQAKQSFQAEIAKNANHEIDFFEVPGAFEIPLQAKLLAKSGCYAAIVAAGLVVDGGIYRHEFVAQSVLNGLMQVQLEAEIPVFSVVLTPHDFDAGKEHITFFREHFVHKGAEAASACMQVLGLVEKHRVDSAHCF